MLLSQKVCYGSPSQPHEYAKAWRQKTAARDILARGSARRGARMCRCLEAIKHVQVAAGVVFQGHKRRWQGLQLLSIGLHKLSVCVCSMTLHAASCSRRPVTTRHHAQNLGADVSTSTTLRSNGICIHCMILHGTSWSQYHRTLKPPSLEPQAQMQAEIPGNFWAFPCYGLTIPRSMCRVRYPQHPSLTICCK